MLPVKLSLEENVCHLLHYNSLMRAQFAPCFKVYREEAQLVIADLFDNIFGNLRQCNLEDEEVVEQLLLTAFRVLKSHHKS